MAVEKKPENMKHWRDGAKTDPAYTKPYTGAGGVALTAINPTYETMRFTELHGPEGGRWWWELVEHGVLETPAGLLYTVLGNLYWPGGEHPICGFGAWSLLDFKGRPDRDAPKKANTAARSKAFSNTGLCADVFLGMFDANGSVAERRAPVALEKATPATAEQVTRIKELAATVYGNGAESHVTDQFNRRNVSTFATLPGETAVRWITYLEARVGTKDAAPDPLPLNTEKEAPNA